MVDFNKLGLLTKQRDILVALFTRRLHRRVLVGVRGQQEIHDTQRELTEALQTEQFAFKSFHGPAVGSTRIESADGVCWIRILDTSRSERLPDKVRALEIDLVWWKHVRWSEEVDTMVRYVEARRVGYNPITLWGDVPADYIRGGYV